MPSKSHRAASRQAKLRQKKRRGKSPVHQDFQSGPTKPQTVSHELTTIDDDIKSTTVPKTLRSQARRSNKRVSDGAIPRYTYLGSELRHIALMAGSILVVLVTASIILGL